MNSTDYYNQNADEFFNTTCDVDLSEIYSKFEKYLPKKATILDAGCGSGRDSKYFLSLGHNVTAMDASEEMVLRARGLTGLAVKKMFFQDISDTNIYDGIWSCASLLHVPKADIDEVFKKFIDALKDKGVWYMSFKYGASEREKDNRLFNDYTEETITELISKYDQLSILELWLTDDRRPDRNDKWLNVIVKKQH